MKSDITVGICVKFTCYVQFTWLKEKKKKTD